MDRVDQLRAARNSPHVSFTEYIKLRARTKGLVLVFEGKQCPAAYIAWLRHLMGALVGTGGQIIARGKRNVLVLRDLILRNPQTANDRNLYFVDRDFDVEPRPGSFPEVYVTNGYSIENELIEWPVLDSFLRAHFDIADSEDHEALQLAEVHFEKLFHEYIAEAKEVHRIVYICRTKGIACYPGDSAFSYIEVDWLAGSVWRSYQSIDELFGLLKIAQGERANILVALGDSDGFEELQPVKDWRGKFHFSFVRGFLIHLRDARVSGSIPFKRAAKLNTDPSSPSLLGLLGSLSICPTCLSAFIGQYAGASPIVHANI